MIIFAWILWSYILLGIIIGFIIIIIANAQNRKYKIDVEDILFKIAIFIFLNLYLFL